MVVDPAAVLVSDGATPAIAQWFDAKKQCPDALIFFRMGDFYELFFADAVQAAAALDIQLTQRGTHAGRPIDMCGVPLHAADSYLARLIRKGFRVAITEQVEQAADRKPGAKTPLRRAIVRLVTPGTLTEESLLEPGRPNLLLALAEIATDVGAAWVDISTGRFETRRVPATALPDLLAHLRPSEVVGPPELDLGAWEGARSADSGPDDAETARVLLNELGSQVAQSLDCLSAPELVAAARAVVYVRATQSGKLPSFSPPRSVEHAGCMQIDAATRSSLEISIARDGGGEHTLLAVVRHTLTAAGARMLGEHLSAPLADVELIAQRQDLWTWLESRPKTLEDLRAALRRTPDVARALGRLSLGRGHPRDLGAVGLCLEVASAVARFLDQAADLPRDLRGLRQQLEPPHDLLALLERALTRPAPARLEDGDTIAAGYDGELDALRRLRDDSRSALAGLQLDLAQRYGVASLKIRHHQQLGFVVEVPAAAVERLRAQPGLVLRQSMASGARFSDPEVAALDQRINESGAEAVARERLLVGHLVDLAVQQRETLACVSDALARLDVAQSAARLVETGRWCRPVVTAGTDFEVERGRHPVVEAAVQRRARFIDNGCDLSAERRLLLLTGPNMAGKSTYLRQNALMVVLAQAGLPLPAERARIGIVDKLFCRVGGADDLARGRSTFMVEMEEAATILGAATSRSFIVIDEIGRGTATLDGLAIAWAMLESLHNRTRARTIFATHFHELARLRHELPLLRPYTMRVKEWRGDVVFLHEVVEGAGGRSWGVQVARLAGVPPDVVRRAGLILKALEARATGLTQDVELPLLAQARQPEVQQGQQILDMLHDLQPDQLTPKQALEMLYDLKSMWRAEAGEAVG